MDTNYIQSENTDVLSPSVAMTEITSIVCEMLQENLDYTAKNGHTERAMISRARLLKLLGITETFNQVSSANTSLKLANKELFHQVQTLKSKLKAIEYETNLANSI